MKKILSLSMAILLLVGCSSGDDGGGYRTPHNETFTVTFYSNAPNGTVASGTMPPQTFTEGTEQPDPDTPKSIPELLKEIISNYDKIAAQLENSTQTITELTITVAGNVFYDLPEKTTAMAIQSVIDRAVQEGLDKAKIETALVAYAEGLLKINKSEECKYSFSKTELALAFTGKFDIDKTYLIIEDGYMDVDLSEAIITANYIASLEEFESIFLDLNPQVTEENFKTYFMGGGSGAETPKESLKAKLDIVPNAEGSNPSLHMRLLIALSNYYGSSSGKCPARIWKLSRHLSPPKPARPFAPAFHPIVFRCLVTSLCRLSKSVISLLWRTKSSRRSIGLPRTSSASIDLSSSSIISCFR